MAITFAGDDDYVDCLSDASIDNIAPITVVGWLTSTDATAGQEWLYKDWDGDSEEGWFVRFEGDVANDPITLYWRWQTTGGLWRWVSAFVGDGTKQHVAITYVGAATTDDPSLYLNGTLQSAPAEASTPVGVAPDDSGCSLIIGSRIKAAQDKPWTGQMEDVRIYNAILTAEQIAALAAGYRGPLGGEVLWLSMNEARTLVTPGTLTQGTHLLADLSANTNDGDPYNGCVLSASDYPRFGNWIPTILDWRTTFFEIFFDATPAGRVKYGASTSSDDNTAEFDATPTGRAQEN